MFIIALIIFTIYLSQKTIRSLHMLQQNRYNRGKKYYKWILQNKKKVLLSEAIFLLCASLLFVYFNELTMFTIFSVISIINIIVLKLKKDNKKTPIVITSRIKRILTTTGILYILIILILLVKQNEINNAYYYILLSLLAYTNNFIVVFINFINLPIEKLVGLYFKNKALTKFKKMTNMETIGITGSYGKTSSKNILADILNVKYNAFKTPKNYNTPFGLMITINEHLDKFTDYFIAEMGACKKGEIKELCNLVTPKYGILTKIGLSHLETFGSVENIRKTKFELIESLPSDGLGVLNGDDSKQLSYQIKNNVAIKYVGIDNKDVDTFASDIKITHQGSSFKVKFKDEKKPVLFNTKLLGRANIYNILQAITLGKHLGISIKELQKAVSQVKSVEHRLQLKRYFDMYLIDDAYNSNPEGAKMALEVLRLMPGTRVIITPGMIELGNKDEEIHYDFGRNIAKSSDIAILIGENKTKDIYRGIIDEGYQKENIYIFNDVQEGIRLLKELKTNKDLFALIENDLPDSFNEKGSVKK